MKRLTAWLALALAPWCALAADQPKAKLPMDPIIAQLTYEPEFHAASWGDRPVTLKRKNTTPYKMRLYLGSLLGELVETYEFNLARQSEVTLETNSRYANRVTITALDKGAPYVSEVLNNTVYVSPEILDSLEFMDFTFSTYTYGMRELPPEYYGKKPHPYTISVGDAVHIHRRNPGVLLSPGKWGWDVPGSPDWRDAFSYVNIPMGPNDYGPPRARSMAPPAAKEGYLRMLYRQNVEKASVFVLNRFTMQNITVDLSRVMSAIYRLNPQTYDFIMERTQRRSQDEQAQTLLAGVQRAMTANRSDDAQLNRTADLSRRMDLVQEFFSSLAPEIDPSLHARWRTLQETFRDEPWQQEIQRTQAGVVRQGAGAPLQDPGDAARSASAQLLNRINASSAGARVKQKAKELDRLIQMTAPIVITAPRDGETIAKRITGLSGRAKSEAGKSVTVRFNGAEQQVSVGADGSFSTDIVLKQGDNELEVCKEVACTGLTVTGDVPRLPLMATLTWQGSTDLDLHVRTPSGANCSYQSKKRPGVCELDIDDTSGRRPENISIPLGGETGTYRFWVDNYSGKGGYSGTLRVYKDGVLSESRDFTTSSSKGKEAEIEIRL